jgi:type VI secretion system secreted protein VgrG
MTEACQFDETDYNYLHRRWEAKGWHYRYEHRKDGHTLILGGDTLLCNPIDGGGCMVWQGRSGVTDCGVIAFSPVRTVASTRYAASSFDFKNPRPSQVEVPSINRQGALPDLEVYEYAGAYGFRDYADGDAYVRLRMEEIEAAGKHFKAAGNDDRAQPGRSFLLSGHLDALVLGKEGGDNEFLILEVRHKASNNYEAQTDTPSEYSNSLTCLRKKIPWRPGRGFNSREPKIHAPQTAIVVGPEGEEIYTDAYGRVCVQFHWDRVGRFDEKSSTWVRVASTWAGNNFGFMAIPRIGQEVIVQWLDGNPDRPLITGRVYNASNMPPWPLPASRTQSGILTRSTQGGYGNANAIRFEDKKGAEELWLHAERDQRIEVERDESHWVGHDRSKTVDHDETVRIQHDRRETVGNDESITIHNNRCERVDHDESISIGDHRREDVGRDETISIGGDRSLTVGGNETETVAQAKAESVGLAKALSVGLGYQVSVGGAMNTSVGLMQAEEVGLSKSVMVGQKFSITVGDELEIKVGKAILTMKSDGTVLINGTRFDFSASGPVAINGKDVDIN